MYSNEGQDSLFICAINLHLQQSARKNIYLIATAVVTTPEKKCSNGVRRSEG